MNKGIQYWLLITLLCAFTSCGALFKGSTQSVGIKSFQQGSTIEVDGQTHVSPALIELPRNQNYVVTISKEGYETQQLRITKKSVAVSLSLTFSGNFARHCRCCHGHMVQPLTQRNQCQPRQQTNRCPRHTHQNGSDRQRIAQGCLTSTCPHQNRTIRMR